MTLAPVSPPLECQQVGGGRFTACADVMHCSSATAQSVYSVCIQPTAGEDQRGAPFSAGGGLSHASRSSVHVHMLQARSAHQMLTREKVLNGSASSSIRAKAERQCEGAGGGRGGGEEGGGRGARSWGRKIRTANRGLHLAVW